MKPWTVASFTVAGALAAVLIVAAYLQHPHPHVTPDWTARQLHESLSSEGLNLEGHEVPVGVPYQNTGYYLRRPGDRRAWEELVRHPRNPATSMRGFVVVTVFPSTGIGGITNSDPSEGRVQVCHLTLLGDPVMLREILEALR